MCAKSSREHEHADVHAGVRRTVRDMPPTRALFTLAAQKMLTGWDAFVTVMVTDTLQQGGERQVATAAGQSCTAADAMQA